MNSSRLLDNCKLLREHLVTLHVDKDINSLFVRFNELTSYIETIEMKSKSDAEFIAIIKRRSTLS